MADRGTRTERMAAPGAALAARLRHHPPRVEAMRGNPMESLFQSLGRVSQSLRSWSNRRGYPAPWLPIPWRWRFIYCKRQYDTLVPLAQRLCRGNRYGEHTPSWPAHRPLGGQCFCSKVRKRLDYLPF